MRKQRGQVDYTSNLLWKTSSENFQEENGLTQLNIAQKITLASVREGAHAWKGTN